MSVDCAAAWAMLGSMVLLQLWATLLSMVTHVATEGHVDECPWAVMLRTMLESGVLLQLGQSWLVLPLKGMQMSMVCAATRSHVYVYGLVIVLVPMAYTFTGDHAAICDTC